VMAPGPSWTHSGAWKTCCRTSIVGRLGVANSFTPSRGTTLDPHALLGFFFSPKDCSRARRRMTSGSVKCVRNRRRVHARVEVDR